MVKKIYRIGLLVMAVCLLSGFNANAESLGNETIDAFDACYYNNPDYSWWEFTSLEGDCLGKAYRPMFEKSASKP